MDNQEKKNFCIFDSHETQKIYEALTGVDLKTCHIPIKYYEFRYLPIFIFIASFIYIIIASSLISPLYNVKLFLIISAIMNWLFLLLLCQLFSNFNLCLGDRPIYLQYDIEFILNMLLSAQKKTYYYHKDYKKIRLDDLDDLCSKSLCKWEAFCIRHNNSDNKDTVYINKWDHNYNCLLNSKEISIYTQFLNDLHKTTTYKALAKINYKLVISFFVCNSLFNYCSSIFFIPDDRHALYLMLILFANTLFFLIIYLGLLDVFFYRTCSWDAGCWHSKKVLYPHMMSYLKNMLDNALKESKPISDKNIMMLKDNNLISHDCDNIYRRKMEKIYSGPFA